jgi:hypothetical protein
MMAFRGAKSQVKNQSRKGVTGLASTPAFVVRSLGLLDPADASEPVNRKQRRAQRKGLVPAERVKKERA